MYIQKTNWLTLLFFIDVAVATYHILTGEISVGGKTIGVGYSGTKGVYRNNPYLSHVKSKGAIPCGFYKIGAAHESNEIIPLATMGRTLGANTDHIFGRNGFVIRGDNDDGDAGEDSVVLDQSIRQQIIGRTKILKVVLGETRYINKIVKTMAY